MWKQVFNAKLCIILQSEVMKHLDLNIVQIKDW